MTTPVRRPDRWEIRQAADHVGRSEQEAQIIEAHYCRTWEMFREPGRHDLFVKLLRRYLAEACIERQLTILSATPVHFRIMVQQFVLDSAPRAASGWSTTLPTVEQVEGMGLPLGSAIEIDSRIEALVIPTMERPVVTTIELDGDGTHHFR